MSAKDLAKQLMSRFPGLITEPIEFRGEISVGILEAERIADICSYAKNALGFDYLVDISSLDNYGDDPRFTLVYHLYGYEHHHYLRLKDRKSVV